MIYDFGINCEYESYDSMSLMINFSSNGNNVDIKLTNIVFNNINGKTEKYSKKEEIIKLNDEREEYTLDLYLPDTQKYFNYNWEMGYYWPPEVFENIEFDLTDSVFNETVHIKMPLLDDNGTATINGEDSYKNYSSLPYEIDYLSGYIEVSSEQ